MFSKISIILLAVSASCSQAYVDEYTIKKYFDVDNFHFNKFVDFTQTYNKQYTSHGSLFQAYTNFVSNHEFIQSYNSSTHTLAMNEYGDLSTDEFRRVRHLMSVFSIPRVSSCSMFESTASSIPSSVDWRGKAVTSVKNQGQCGSCWSFSSAGAMEGAYAVSTGDLIDLSEQQLMDCTWTYGDFGCSGGLMDNAFAYAIEHGMCLEDDVPYLAENQKCASMPQCDVVAKFSDCFDVTSKNQLHLKEAVSFQPVSVAIEADTRVFQFYQSGIIDSADCGTTLDHGVLVVGYGEENGQKYWTVKNSWGSDWGESGYVRIARSDSTDDAGICGIAMQPSYIVH